MNHKFITSFYYVIVALICTQTAQAKNDDTQYIPLLQYDDVHLRTHNIQSSSIGLLTQNADIMFIGLYTKHDFNAPLAYNFPQQYHTIDTLLDAKNGRDQYLGIFKSQSDQPIGGGINTFHAGVVYGYEFIRRKDFSLVLGGGIAAG
ncbi:MAG: hypothetical protein OEW58_03070, partial [Gammaproteobacteria bacterium]|nr:hypothetical protein [Gammaproteobacteria bacterium]